MKKCKLFMLMSSALLIAACSSENGKVPAFDNGRVALQVTGGITITRAHDDQWDSGDKIGIYMYQAGTQTIAEQVVNYPYIKNDNANTFAPVDKTIYLPIDGSNVDVFAWYPYSATANTVTFDLTNQAVQKNIDLMTATANSATTAINKNAPAVAFNFNHRLTKLQLTFLTANGFAASNLAGLKVEITQQNTGVSFLPGENSLTPSNNSLATIELLTASDGSSAEAILVPTNLTGSTIQTGRRLVFTLSNGEEFHYNIPDNKAFNAGEKNSYTITFNGVSVDVTATITNWTVVDGGSYNAER